MKAIRRPVGCVGYMSPANFKRNERNQDLRRAAQKLCGDTWTGMCAVINDATLKRDALEVEAEMRKYQRDREVNPRRSHVLLHWPEEE